MAFTKPTELPEWATSKTVEDPVSHINNVVAPDPSLRVEGWWRGGKPPRQYQNWLANLYYNWIGWISQELNKIIADRANGVVDAIVTTDYVDTQIDVQIKWNRFGNRVMLLLPQILGTQNVNNGLFKIEPKTEWDSKLVALGTGTVIVQGLNDNHNEAMMLFFPNTTTDSFDVLRMNNQYFTGTDRKGISNSYVSYLAKYI